METSASTAAQPVNLVESFDALALGNLFQGLFGDARPRFFVAPGRVNLIGEHTDYNDGFVLPLAINRGTLIAGRSRADRKIRVHSIERQETREFSLDGPLQSHPHDWLSYVEGEARSLEESGWRINGADLLIESNVPVGSGLSSSAALENSVGFALLSLNGYSDIDLKKLALAGQSAEHRYVGTKCGIMDQFITAMGQQRHALLIDCRTLEATPIPLDLPGIAVVIVDSGVKHELASSAYNERRRQCQDGVAFFQQFMPDITALRDISTQAFERYESQLPDPTIRKRMRHVITENERTLFAAEALKHHDAERLGQLMNASHQSLQLDYEVSCAELDLLVELAQGLDGVIGARMTGGGFGGCTVNLVRIDALEGFKQTLEMEYNRQFEYPVSFYVTQPQSGVREL